MSALICVFRLCYISVLILIDIVDSRCGRRLLRGNRVGRYTAGAISDEEDWRMPRGKRPSEAEINNTFKRDL